jgi:HlyD family secretion protein
MDQNALFRKSALDKLSSPERLDVLMQVTSPKGWAALTMMGIILSGTVVWGFVGNIPSLAQGNGILIPQGGLRQLFSNGEGQVTKLLVEKNTSIDEGTVIAELSMPDIEDKIRVAAQRRDDLRREAADSASEDSATNFGAQQTIIQLDAEKRRIEAEIVAKNEELKMRREQLTKGIITAARVQQVEREISGLRNQVLGLNGQIQSARVGTRSTNQRIRSRQQMAEDAQREVERLEGLRSRVTQVRSTQKGRIVEMRKNVGDPVRMGELIATVEPTDAKLDAIVYVNAADAIAIKPGMDVRVSPLGVDRERYGFVKGVVEAINNYAATPESIAQIVANQAVARELLGDRSKVEMRVKMLPNENTISKLQWSTRDGAPENIGAGTRLGVEVVVERRRPITFVIPKLKEMLGLS